jgi:hypothetical protein
MHGVLYTWTLVCTKADSRIVGCSDPKEEQMFVLLFQLRNMQAINRNKPMTTGFKISAARQV